VHSLFQLALQASNEQGQSFGLGNAANAKLQKFQDQCIFQVLCVRLGFPGRSFGSENKRETSVKPPSILIFQPRNFNK
jgi:hypothetical protein